MGMKSYAKTTIAMILLAALVACGNSKQLEAEKKSLQTENEALKVQVKQLTDENDKFKAELEDMKQTDQYLFSKAKELASSNAEDAKELLDKLLTRFPNSAYKAQATGLLKDVNNKISIADAVENGESEISSAISSRAFSKAWATLRSIKKYISGDKYNELAKAIDEEQNKPIQVSVLELLSDKSKYGGKKVMISGYIAINFSAMSKFTLVDADNTVAPSVDVIYGHLPTEAKKRLLPLESKYGNRNIGVFVVGVFNGDDTIRLTEATF